VIRHQPLDHVPPRRQLLDEGRPVHLRWSREDIERQLKEFRERNRDGDA
jgi:hypothetical protein